MALGSQAGHTGIPAPAIPRLDTSGYNCRLFFGTGLSTGRFTRAAAAPYTLTAIRTAHRSPLPIEGTHQYSTGCSLDTTLTAQQIGGP